MKTILFAEKNKDYSFFISIFIIGVLTMLRDKKISIDDAEKLIFRPGVAEYLKDKIDKKIVDLIFLGCELEDIESLIPDELDANIEELLSTCSSFIENKSLVEKISIYLGEVTFKKNNKLSH